MIDPWIFDNEIAFPSGNSRFTLQYENLHELSQGSPLMGECYLLKPDKKVLIDKTCSGPPLWSKESTFFLVPVWRKTFLKGWIQQIGFVDLEKESIKLGKRHYSVIHFIRWQQNMLEFIDSPIYHSKHFIMAVEEMEFEKEERLNNIR